jgi:hypothetical protein
VGGEERFAAEIGEQDEYLRKVEAWAADQALTCDDNMACILRLRRGLQLGRIRPESGVPVSSAVPA